MASLLLGPQNVATNLARGHPLTPAKREKMVLKYYRTKSKLDKMLKVRMDENTLNSWRVCAAAARLPLSEWLRSQVGEGRMPPGPPRRDPPPADPALLAQIARCGNNLNQLARAANRQQWPDRAELLLRLAAIERALAHLVPTDDG